MGRISILLVMKNSVEIMKVFVFMMTALDYVSNVYCQQIHSIRLTGGSNLYTGQLEVLYCETTSTCAWTPVCWNNWTDATAVIACKQLGLHDSSYNIDYESGSDWSSGNTVDIQCDQLTNDSLSLNECNVTLCMANVVEQTTVITCATPLEAPTFNVPGVSATSATVDWTILGSRSATKYYVSCTNGPGTPYSHLRMQLESVSRLSGLTPYTNYSCCVSGIDLLNVVGSESCTTFQTLVGAPVVAPGNLRITELRSQNITLEWDELPLSDRAGPQNMFSLSVSVSGCSPPPSTVTSDTQITVSNLCPYFNYNISIRACNSDTLCGPYSPTIQVQTPESTPSMVMNLSCSAVSSTQIHVTWTPPLWPNGVIRHYEVVLRNMNTMQNITHFVNGQTTTATISHLQPNQQYYCSVAAHTIARGEFIPNEISIFANTSEDVPSAAPLDLTSSEVTRSSFKLNWNEPPVEMQNGYITGYRIKVTGSDNTHQLLAIDDNTVSTQPVTVSVNQSTTYCVSITAMTRVGVGPYSESIILTTLSTEKERNGPIIALSSIVILLFVLLVLSSGLFIHYSHKVGISSKHSTTSPGHGTGLGHHMTVIENESSLSAFNTTEKKTKPPVLPPRTDVNKLDYELDSVKDVDLPRSSSTDKEANKELLCQTHSRNPQGQQPHNQKTDTKDVYEDIDSVRLQREMITAARNRQDSTKPGTQYESLQLKNMDKPSEYQQLSPTGTKL